MKKLILVLALQNNRLRGSLEHHCIFFIKSESFFQKVDKVMEEAVKVGAVIAVPAHDTFWGGYSGYFQDTDGHLWEVV
ncbi:VOC family protein [Paenibacillus sp. 8b26]|uniref:VOC family protein n=1 Tax=Paenibacillus sp. 8b26 TaxID=3424133 RepID=UPI003D653DDD